MEEWVEGVSDAQQLSEGDLEAGTKLKSKYNYRGKTFDVEYEVTEYDPPGRFGTKWTEGPFPFESLIELKTYAGQHHGHQHHRRRLRRPNHEHHLLGVRFVRFAGP